MYVRAAFICDQGKVRANNEDNYYFNGKFARRIHKKGKSFFEVNKKTRNAALFSIFDGMGGEQYGETASFIAAKYMKQCIDREKTKIPSDFFRGFCQKVNTLIFRKSKELQVDRVGTTMAAVYFQYDRAWICNVGDSRIYWMHNGELVQISHDHTNQEYLDSGGAGNVKPGLTQHLGMDPKEYYLNPYVDDVKTQPGDRFLICSDGLTDMVNQKEIGAILEHGISAKKCVRELVNRALTNGGRDNITAIVCFVH